MIHKFILKTFGEDYLHRWQNDMTRLHKNLLITQWIFIGLLGLIFIGILAIVVVVAFKAVLFFLAAFLAFVIFLSIFEVSSKAWSQFHGRDHWW